MYFIHKDSSSDEKEELVESFYVFGAGVSGIMTALYASLLGMDVQLFSQGADPRFHKDRLDAKAGATWGGGETRMMTPTEGDVYLGSGPIYSDMAAKFERTVAEGGWLDDRDLSDVEKQWIYKRQLYNVQPDYIGQVRGFYKRANTIGNASWKKLVLDMPELFENTYISDDVIRTYDTAHRLDSAVRDYENEGEARSVFRTSEDIQKHHPCFFRAAADGHIAGIMDVS